MRGFFITGTDTGVGKTTVAVSLIKALRYRNYLVMPKKPVESGCTVTKNGLYPQDAAKLLQAANNSQLNLNIVCPHKLKNPLSPARAAKLENYRLNLPMLIAACRAPKDHTVVIEGAGGFYSPICQKTLNADLAQILKLPIILVAANRLGVVHQVLSTTETIFKRNLPISCIVLNNILPDYTILDNQEEIREFLPTTPIVTTPFSENGLSVEIGLRMVQLLEKIKQV